MLNQTFFLLQEILIAASHGDNRRYQENEWVKFYPKKLSIWMGKIIHTNK